MPSPSLRPFFLPQSVSFVGASTDLSLPASRALRFISRDIQKTGREIRLYPVNPKYHEILGYPCYASLAKLPEVPELVIISVNAMQVLDVVKQGHACGAVHFIVFSSGFSGSAGNELQRNLSQYCQTNQLKVLGPNTGGIFNLADGVSATFSTILEKGDHFSGSAAFVSQSGGMATYTYAMGQERGIGFSYVVSTGNEVSLEAADFVDYLLEKDEVRVVGCFLEGIRDGRKFIRVAQKALQLGKPLVVLKGGFSKKAGAAAKSHTGSITGSAQVNEAVFEQYGVILAHTPEELLDIVAILQARIPVRGRNTGIFSGSGGFCVLLADQCERVGLRLPDLASHTLAGLEKALPPFASPGNPTDSSSVRKPEPVAKSLPIMAADPNIDHLLIFTGYGGASAIRLAEIVVEAAQSMDKYCGMIWLAPPPEVRPILAKGQVPLFESIRACLGPLSKAGWWFEFAAARRDAKDIEEQLLPEIAPTTEWINLKPGESLTEVAAKSALGQMGLPMLAHRMVASADEAVQAATEIGYPVVVKVVSPDLPHKTEVGGVMLDLRGPAEVRQGVLEMGQRLAASRPSAVIEGYLVEKMAPRGIEVIIGITHDAAFGPVMMFGAGGIYTEVYKDVSFRALPVYRAQIESMVAKTKVADILKGARGTEYDLEALYELLQSVAQVGQRSPVPISELDLNPVIVHPRGGGISIADALLTLAEETPEPFRDSVN